MRDTPPPSTGRRIGQISADGASWRPPSPEPIKAWRRRARAGPRRSIFALASLGLAIAMLSRNVGQAMVLLLLILWGWRSSCLDPALRAARALTRALAIAPPAAM